MIKSVIAGIFAASLSLASVCVAADNPSTSTMKDVGVIVIASPSPVLPTTSDMVKKWESHGDDVLYRHIYPDTTNNTSASYQEYHDFQKRGNTDQSSESLKPKPFDIQQPPSLLSSETLVNKKSLQECGNIISFAARLKFIYYREYRSGTQSVQLPNVNILDMSQMFFTYAPKVFQMKIQLRDDYGKPLIPTQSYIYVGVLDGKKLSPTDPTH